MKVRVQRKIMKVTIRLEIRVPCFKALKYVIYMTRYIYTKIN